MLPPDLLLPVLGAAASAGAAWGAVKVSLNGTRKRVQDIEIQVNQQRIASHSSDDRLARVETKIDLLLIDKALR